MPHTRTRSLLRLAVFVSTLFPALSCSSSPAPSPSPEPAAPVIAIENVSVVRVDRGDVVGGRTVVIEGNRIARIGAAGHVRVPAGATRVDGAGRFLVPGLWDMHVHAWQQATFQDVFLANGITGIREMGTGMDGIYGARAGVWAWRDAVRAGRAPGPRIVAAGMILNGGTPESPAAPFYAGIPTPAAGRAWVDSLAGRGADFLKLYSGLSDSVYAAIVLRAKERGLVFAGHAPASVGAVAASNAGQRSIEHLFDFLISSSTLEDSVRRDIADAIGSGRGHPGGYAQETENALSDRLDATRDAAKEAALIATLRRNGTWVTPTLVTLFDPRAEGGGIDSAKLSRVPQRVHFLIVPRDTPTVEALGRERRRIDRQLALVAALHRAGVRLLAGSDPPNTFVYPGASLHDELALLVRAGLAPAEALRAATLEPARYLAATDSLGTVAVGKLADLVLLDADPLADIGNTRRIAAVIANGNLLRREELEARLRLLTAPPAQ